MSTCTCDVNCSYVPVRSSSFANTRVLARASKLTVHRTNDLLTARSVAAMRTASSRGRECSTAVPPRPKGLPARCSLSSLQPFLGSHILRSPFSEDSSHPSLLLSSVVRLGSLRTAFSPLFSLLAAHSLHKNSGHCLAFRSLIRGDKVPR